MFYFVLLMIGLTNLALGYAVATQFGFGPKPAEELAAARADAAAHQPSFSITGGDDETPIDRLPPAEPVEHRVAESVEADLPQGNELTQHVQ